MRKSPKVVFQSLFGLPSALSLTSALTASFLAWIPEESGAVEGGIGAYFLGTRDTLSGIVPPPGTYLTFSFDRLEGSVDGVSIGGLPIRANAEIDLNLYRFGVTQVFDTVFWGGTPALNLTVPVPDISLSYVSITPPINGARINDTASGLGDIAVTGFVGWHRDTLHYSTGMSVYAPTGNYRTASIDVANRTIDAVSTSKNVWSFQPYVAVTSLNPQTGLELSGVASLLVSTKNEATDYQTAPALQLEGTIVQRLPSSWGFGLTGYTYQQLSNDSGSGARVTQSVLGASSLKARVSGIGPIVTYSGGMLFGGDLSFKAKYVKEFAAKRRLESDIFTISVSLAF